MSAIDSETARATAETTRVESPETEVPERAEIRKPTPALPASVDWRPTRSLRIFPGCPGDDRHRGGTLVVIRFMVIAMV
jgi:hypothetical protein